MQSPGEGEVMKFFGAAAPHYRRFAPVRGGSGVATPARLTRGTNEPKGEIWATGRYLLVYHFVRHFCMGTILIVDSLKPCPPVPLLGTQAGFLLISTIQKLEC